MGDFRCRASAPTWRRARSSRNVKPGDRVKRGDIIAVVETDKGAFDTECYEEG